MKFALLFDYCTKQLIHHLFSGDSSLPTYACRGEGRLKAGIKSCVLAECLTGAPPIIKTFFILAKWELSPKIRGCTYALMSIISPDSALGLPAAMTTV